MFFRFPPDAHWNANLGAVEFGIGVGEYAGVVRIPRRVFQGLLDQAATPERCLEAYHLERTRLELIAERKLRRRQLTDDANIEITGRDLRERNPQPAAQPLIDRPMRSSFRISSLVGVVVVLAATSVLAREPMTDVQVRDAIVKESVAAYLATSHPCACPYNIARNGSSCGGRSAYSRPGGAAPLCYPRDVGDAMVAHWRRSHQ
jgi:hypothetical protein